MPKTYDLATRIAFHKLLGVGLSQVAAAERLGVHPSTAYRWKMGGGDHDGMPRQLVQRLLATEFPSPLSYDMLSTDAKAMLADFDVFCEAALARRPAPWRRDAAMRTVSYLTDRTERSFVVANVFPGSGKSTLWTKDIPLWLVCGGGVCDPAWGRALRFMLGHESKGVSIHYVKAVRRVLDLRRPFWDKEQSRRAEVVLQAVFGRFRPEVSLGDESLWREDQFLVAQLEELDLYEKEPTFQAASRQAGFLGERVDYVAWDDLVTSKNSRDPKISGELATWFENEAEPRVEPGGVLFLVGQRLSPLDLFRNRLDVEWTDDEGASHRRYDHIVYPAHHEATCDGAHRQWDLADDGCLLDSWRMPWKELVKLRSGLSYRTIMQQEDADPTSTLVLAAWIEGGYGPYGEEYPGCYDTDRGFFEHPPGVNGLIDYACIDPSRSGFWAIEWWAVEPASMLRYLIWGTRRKMGAGDLLDWNASGHRFTGVMEEIQSASVAGAHPIKVWVLEANAWARWLQEYDHYRRWIARWGFLTVIPHQTQMNKLDPKLGVEGTLPMAYRTGMKRLPRKEGTEALNYIRWKTHELTTWPHAATDDTVMCDWIGEYRLPEIIRIGQRPMEPFVIDVRLPAYLERQRREVRTAPVG